MSEVADTKSPARPTAPASGSKPLPRLRGEALESRREQLPGWEVVWEHHLERRFDLPDFQSALALVVSIGEIAEAAGHHPDLFLSVGKVGVQIWTHSVGGLTERDFQLAQRIDRAARSRGVAGA